MSQISASYPKNLLKQPLSWLYSLWKFSRPHTIIGTTLSVLALYTIALATTHSSINLANLGQILGTWLACLCGNVYIVGLNQLQDLEIDKINKPHLPLAAGEFSLRQGRWIVGITGVCAILLAAGLGVWLLAVVGISLAIGTAYSLPPIRLKRFPLWAAFCIFTVRGVIVNLGLFLHFRQKLDNQTLLPATVWALTLFILVFTVAIAIFKDVPDLEGDKQYNITTFTIILGRKSVFDIACAIINICYLGMIIAGFFWIEEINHTLIFISHFGLLALLWWRVKQVDLQEKAAITSFYQFIWKLFFIEYLIFPAACLLN